MYYEFIQNNSGGDFDFDKEAGITHYVIIEADSEEEAVDKAREIGLYENGVAEGLDCPCCGDRWSFNPASCYPKFRISKILFRWMPPGHEVAVHRKDGTIEWPEAWRG